MPIPTRWEGCEHVVECLGCNGEGFSDIYGTGVRRCPICYGLGVRWNGLTIPENMLIRGYLVKEGHVWYTPSNSVYGGFTLTEAQICSNIWELDGPVVPWKPAPLHLLDGVPVCTSN